MNIKSILMLCLILAVLTTGCVNNKNEQVEAGIAINTSTEKTDNLTPPQQLTEQQFNESMNEYLTKYTDARFVFGEFSPDNKYLAVYTNQPFVGGNAESAFYLQNYINLYPNLKGYNVLIVSPVENAPTIFVELITYAPERTTLVRQSSYMGSDGTVYSNTVATWTDTTYTVISKAIETGEYTNDPEKLTLS